MSDLAEAHVFAVDYLLKGGAGGGFNVGTGQGHSVKEVVTAVERITGQKVPYIMGPRREGDPPRLVADSRKLQETTGWKPVRANLDHIVGDAWEFAQKLYREQTQPASSTIR